MERNILYRFNIVNNVVSFLQFITGVYFLLYMYSTFKTILLHLILLLLVSVAKPIAIIPPNIQVNCYKLVVYSYADSFHFKTKAVPEERGHSSAVCEVEKIKNVWYI